MNGYEKAKKQAGELKSKVKVETEKKELEIKEAVNSLATVEANSVLLELYKENARVGTSNLGGQSPLLKVHKVGKSTTNQLADGSEPKDGWFFYKTTAEQFEKVECHILTISKGFRASGINKENVFNQIVAGVIINDGRADPFIMYLTGTKLKKMWEFGKEISKYTNAKPIPIPMFAIKVVLSTENLDTEYGKSWVINFDVVKDEFGSPVVVTDPGLFTFLRDSVASVEDTIASLIAVRSPEEEDPPINLTEEEPVY